jgi:hypothetical protein
LVFVLVLRNWVPEVGVLRSIRLQAVRGGRDDWFLIIGVLDSVGERVVWDPCSFSTVGNLGGKKD